MSSFHAELASAFRSLGRAPGFSALAITLLALGIGANTAIFSLFQSIVLSPLPYPEPGRLVGFTALNSAKALAMPALSAPDFRDYHSRAKSFVALGACRPDFVTYAPAGGDPVQWVAAHVTENFFPVFGRTPVAGRGFQPEEFSLAAPRTAVISHALWRRQFAERPDVLGTTVILNDVPTTLVGVMPADFREPDFVDVWLPFPIEAPENLARDSRFWSTIGRLAPGVEPATAQAEAAAIAAVLADEYPATNRGWTVSVQPLLELRIAGLRRTLLLLVGAVGLVLLIACVNLANLLLARGVARLPELSVRLALGATPGALARTVFLESVLLALLGGGAGIALAAAGLPVLTQQLPAGLVPRAHEVGVNLPALGFALTVSVLTGLVFGLLPAWQVLRTDVSESLKSGGGRSGTGRFAGRAQAGLITSQVALTVIVLSGAALLMKSLLNLQRTPPGFDAGDVLTVRLAPPPAKWETLPELATYYERALDELRRVPGVESVAVNSSAPLSGITLRYPFWVQGRPRSDGNADEAVFNSISPDYFRTLRQPLLRGRILSEGDRENTPKVCVINQALAQRLFPGEDPIGRRIQTLPWLTRDYREIVGIVGDVRQDNLSDPPPPQIYVPLRQSPWFFATLLVRVQGGAAQTPAIQAALRRADPTASLTFRSLEDNIALTATVPRLRTVLFALFAAIALGLSAFGIYASMAFTVNQRVREIGVRMALGASPARILGEVLSSALKFAAAGVAAGLGGSLALARMLRGLLHGVEPADPWVLAGLALLVPLLVLLASAQPAFRTARMHPIRALNSE